MAANYVLLERIELNASAASVTFSNIPQSGYTDLKIVASVRSSRPSATWDNLQIRLNGSTTSYSARYLLGNGSSASSGTLTTLYGGDIPAVNATSQTFSNAEYYFPNYLSNAYKSVSLDSVAENNATATNQFLTAGLWSNTAAINSIEMFSGNAENFVQYSTFSLYGLAAVGTTPTIAPKASGGNRIDYDGTYWIHTFNTSGAFVPQVGLTCDYLVVAGGGGGFQGGGGAGGLRSTVTATGGGGSLESALSLTAGTNYTVTIGAGGAAQSSGNNSVFSTITATAGGRGGKFDNSVAPDTGGSGGGGGGSDSTGYSGAAGTANQGRAGGNGFAQSGTGPAGGGGGASTVGSNGTTNVAGNGGAGVATSITGTSVTYAGGGGGGVYGSGTTGGTGGSGGGGNGGSGASPGTNAVAGTTNTGSGGGGAGFGTSGAGGSGVVIIRYLA